MEQEEKFPQPGNETPSEPLQAHSKNRHMLKIGFIAASVIILAVSTTYAFFPEKIEDLLGTEQAAPQESPTQEQEVIKDTQVAIERCANNTVKEYGTVDPKKDILVYKTECHTRVWPNNSTDLVTRYYIRDAQGTFNKLVAGVWTPSNAFRSSSASVNADKNKLEIYGLGEEYEVSYFSRTGEQLSEGNNPDPYNLERSLSSPDGNWEIITYASDHPNGLGRSAVIRNTKSGQEKTYAIDNGLNGVFPAGWSLDNKIAYLQGGVWEFGAPATLWKIDVTTGQLSEFQNLEGFSFPIKLYPEYDTAYLLKDDMERRMSSGEDIPAVDITLYSFSLSNPQAPVPVHTEKGQYAFDDLVRVGTKLIYTVNHQWNEDTELRELDLATGVGKSLLRGKYIYHLRWYSERENWFPLLANGTYKIHLRDGSTVDIGTKGNEEEGLRVPTDNTEYVSAIIGILPVK